MVKIHRPLTGTSRHGGFRYVPAHGPSVLKAFTILLLTVSVGVGLPRSLAAQASLLTPTGVVQPGLSSCDDCNDPVSITEVFPTGVNFGGTVYTQIYIGSNGYITFGHGNDSFSPEGITAYTQGPIVAAQFDDLDPGMGGDIFYNQNAGSGYVVVTFQAVAPFSTPTGSGAGTNTYQIVLRTGGEGPQDFEIELRYNTLDWAKSGNNTAWPTAGWSAGDEATYAELPQSGQADFRDILTGSNIGSSGVYRWEVIGGVVQSTPTVNATTAPGSITATSASSGGNVSSDGGLTVTARGVAFGTASGPTTADQVASGGSGTGSFSVDLTGLSVGTTYYIRAYATNALGTAYGPERSFTTLSVTTPTVTTSAAGSITATSAATGGNVTDDGGAAVTVRGVAYGIASGPTTAGDTLVYGSGTGAFSSDLTDLDPGTTYYVRAFATNSEGTSYGGEESFTTLKLDQTITFADIGALTYGDASVALSATASSGLAVTFSSSDPAIAQITGSTMEIVGAGSVTVTANQAGNGTYNAAQAVQQNLEIGKHPVEGSFDVPSRKVYDGTTTTAVTDRMLDGVLPGDVGEVELSGGTAHFQDPEVGENKLVRLHGPALTGSRASHYTLTRVAPVHADIIAAEPHHITLEGPATMVAGGEGSTFHLTVRDQWGHASPVSEVTTFSLSSSAEGDGPFFDPAGTVTIAAGEATASFRYLATTAEPAFHRIIASWVEGTALPGGNTAQFDLAVESGSVAGFSVEGEGGGLIGIQTVGIPFNVRITAMDGFGNRARDFSGTVTLSSDSGLNSGSVTGNFVNGVLDSHAVALSEPGRFSLTVTESGGSATGTSSIFPVVVPGDRISVAVSLSDDRPALGDTIQVGLTVTNWGADPAEDLSVPNPLSSQPRLNAVSITADSGEFDAEAEIWRLERLEPGQEARLTITAVVATPDSASGGQMEDR